MLSFAVYTNGKPAEKVNLAGAYVVGSDDVPLRAEISFKNGVITCKKRSAGPAGLVLLWDVGGVGRIMLETSRVLERKQPYVLQIELARGRLTRICGKVEDWGLIDYDGTDVWMKPVDAARDTLIRALQADNPADAAAIGQQALEQAAKASEGLTRFHAGVLLQRRRQSGGFPKRVFGCAAPTERPGDLLRQRMTAAFDYVTLPVVWRDIEPTQQLFNWKILDAWVEHLVKNRIPIKGSSLLSLREGQIPDWLFMYEHDFDTIRDMAFEHGKRVLSRYGQYIQVWDVISGIHAPNCFTLSFDQVMELTRMAAALAKSTLGGPSRSLVIIDLVVPWGEYYARNQRTVPPLLYADMVAQSGINFDAFGLQFQFGPGRDGMFVRDMFQISSLLDAFARMGKSVHVTAVEVPSDTATIKTVDGPADPRALDGGTWHAPWSEQVQSDWLRSFTEVALSKPFVDSLSWRGISDHPGAPIPHCGLLRSDLTPKAAFQELIKLRAELSAGSRGA
jgi:GH35 family endo-1,4-beta-xylanase